MAQQESTLNKKNRIETKSPLWLDTVVLILCIGISYFGPVSFPWKVPLIATIIISYVYAYNFNLVTLGLTKVDIKKTIFGGFTLAFIVVVGISNLLIPLLEQLLQQEVDTSAYGALEGNFSYVAKFLVEGNDKCGHC